MDYRRTDPEFAERMEYFARTEVGADPDCALDPVTRSLAVLAVLVGCQGGRCSNWPCPKPWTAA